MIEAASSDFICYGIRDFCYTDVNTCDAYYSSMKNITFILEQNEYTIPPEAYTISDGLLGGHACSVAISYSDDAMGLYILGDSFLRSFVSSYDYDNKKIRFAQNKNAYPGTLMVHNPTELNMLLIIGLALGAILLMYCCCKKKKEDFRQDNTVMR